MDGYSVKDAAIVLGIPERRVWELLARGVLAGAPEGPDGMIVYLQPRSAPASVAASAGPSPAGSEGASPKANGNGGSSEFSPFRELLTEFRNLTERYGQALLALGEARGEVASLRSRVDLLEARMDLRLPSSQPTSTVAWEIPEFAAPEAEGASAPTASFVADASLAVDAALDELVEAVAGEDEPAAEPMIDLVEEAVLADVLEAVELEVDGAEAGEEEPPSEALVDEVVPPETAIPDPGTEPRVDAQDEAESEPIAEAAVLEEATQEPEAPKRRARGGRTATAAFAAALARADDPTIAELPGAEETAAALAALQRDIDASRAAEPDVETGLEPPPVESAGDSEPEPEERMAEAEPVPVEGVAEADAPVAEIAADDEAAPIESPPEDDVPTVEPGAVAIVVEDAATPEDQQPEPMATDIQEPEEMAAALADAPEPEQPSVPSYYSTDVVDPDWFADGDFSWLEAAQAEGMRIENDPPSPAAEPKPAEPQAAAVDEPFAEAAAEPQEPDTQAHDDGAGMAASEAHGEGVAAELAFGKHPATEATQPDIGHEGFEPSMESQALAEEEARTAIQDAFEEAPADYEPAAADVAAGAAAATTVAEAAPQAEPQPDHMTAVDEPESEPPPESAIDEPQSAAAAAQAMDEPRAEPEYEAPAEEPRVAVPIDAAGLDVHAEPEVEVEAEAIQDAFDETNPAPTWSPPMATAEPAFDEPTDAPNEEPPAPDGSPPAMAATAYRGPEEFIAPAAVAGAVDPAPTMPAVEPPPRAASDEEELMWLGEEFEESDLEVAAQGWRSPSAPPAAPAGPSPVLELTDSELAQLAEDEGWDREEVDAIRRLLGRPSDAPDLDTSAHILISSPEASPPPVSPGPVGVAPPPSFASARRPADSQPPAWSSQPSSGQPGTEADDVEDPEWLQGRSGAAADAYRRLRKLFPS